MSSCALHPAAESTFTCSRCGTFGCPACESRTPGLCETCASRGDDVGTGVGIGDLITGSLSAVAKNLPLLFSLAVIQAAVTTVVALLSVLPFMGLVLLIPNILVTIVLQAAWILAIAGAVRGQNETIGDTLKRAPRFLLPLFLSTLLVVIGVVVGTFLLIIPGIIVALGWGLSAPAVVLGGCQADEAIKQSWNLTDGYKLTLLVVYFVIGVLSLGVAFVTRLPLLVLGSLKIMPLTVFAEAVSSALAAMPLLAVPVVAYLRLIRR